jgi:hypothetical protein
MKYLILMMAVLFSQSIFAQNRTGTGGVLDVPETLLDPDHYQKKKGKIIGGFTKGGGRENWKVAIEELSEALYLQDQKCHSTIRPSNYIKNTSFMDTYLVLSTVKTINASEDECSDINKYFTCLYSPEVKEKTLKVLKEKDIKAHIQKEYELSKKQSKQIIKFYEDLVKKCEDTSGCKM